MEAFAIHGREEISREELIKEFHKRGIPIRKLSKEDAMAEVEALECL
ncbi:hypothetical protein OCC_05114 [Thermococcus litoralis DSM 5473]|uniref:Uncharacterized protein n=1 Tax=Thermococcus litoralis (strain ATCC 51850 / DSM 5473 / JCM 8560 / NS-C) TaxID=523849 RepID=H3ZN84_THELN|nr:hypothetical protein [Thermococcus litoralis]EHR78595.1 hypothetical protein OCC_05114 [Thermococcus litoralis DSM 5473]